jgi:hypothetical protein
MRIFAKATLPVCTCRPMKPESGSSLLMRPRKRSFGSPGSAMNFVDGWPLSSTSYVRSVTVIVAVPCAGGEPLVVGIILLGY